MHSHLTGSVFVAVSSRQYIVMSLAVSSLQSPQNRCMSTASAISYDKYALPRSDVFLAVLYYRSYCLNLGHLLCRNPPGRLPNNVLQDLGLKKNEITLVMTDVQASSKLWEWCVFLPGILL